MRDSPKMGLKLSEKYIMYKKEILVQLCRFHTQRVRKRPHTQMHAAFPCSFKELSPVFKHFKKQVFNA